MLQQRRSRFISTAVFVSVCCENVRHLQSLVSDQIPLLQVCLLAAPAVGVADACHNSIRSGGTPPRDWQGRRWLGRGHQSGEDRAACPSLAVLAIRVVCCTFPRPLSCRSSATCTRK